MFNFVKDVFLLNKIFENLLLFKNNKISTTEKILNDKEKKIFFIYGAKNLSDYYFVNFMNVKSFLIMDKLWVFFYSKKFILNEKNLFSSYFSILSSDYGFFFNFKKLKKKSYFDFYIINTFLSGFKFIWTGLRFWMAPMIIFTCVIYFTLVLSSLPFNKVMFSWICMLMFMYWLISGFVFFFKKYQFGKYTTSVQSFWSSSYMLFWMMEGGTFLVFLYLTVNSSQESFYMYDQISVFKSHLYSWKYFLLKLFPTIILLLSCYLLMMSLKWNLYSSQSMILLVLTFFLSYMVWLEFYQFFHVVNFYGNLNWIYDMDDHSWSLELEPSSTSMVNHYVMLLFILKFWHIVFMYGFWIFFVLSCWETKSVSYPLLAANFQNFVMLYMFAWVFMYPWFKFYFSKFLDVPYYWFYMNNSKMFLSIFFNDLKLFYYGLIYFNNNFYLNNLYKFNNNSFFYWKNLNYSNNFENFKKSYMKDSMIMNLVNLK